MDNLWKKETTRDEYIDLYASLQRSSLDDMFATLLSEMHKTQKSNELSTEWRLKGNEQFARENWPDAVLCYNKSLCYAEVGSENVALAFSNRSACHFRAQLFDKALVDIELAKKEKLPDRLVPKLDQRRIESVILVSMIERKAKIEVKLSYKADRKFPCMANVIEIKYNEEFGRHLVAKCDIPVGRTVLLEKDFLQLRHEPSVCYSCSQLSMNCIPCPNCPDVMFCSVECINKDLGHMLECGTFLPKLPLQNRYVMKTLFLAITSFPDVDSLIQFVDGLLLEKPEALPTSLHDPKSKYHFFFKLSTSARCPSLRDAHKIYKTAMDLPKVSSLFDSDRKKRFLMHLSMQHVLVYNCNAFGDEHKKYVAYVTSFLNHSCYPNTISYPFRGNVIGVVARPIKKGEQLFINYSQELNEMTTNKRRSELKSQRGFGCKCEKCEPTRAPIDQKLMTSDPCYKYVIKNQNIDVERNPSESAIIKKKCIEFLNKYGRSAWSSEIEFIYNLYGDYLVNTLYN